MTGSAFEVRIPKDIKITCYYTSQLILLLQQFPCDHQGTELTVIMVEIRTRKQNGNRLNRSRASYIRVRRLQIHQNLAKSWRVQERIWGQSEG